jgi:oxygen-dependent protoporphyrinogen oxidase
MDALAEALARALGPGLELGRRATSLAREAHGFRVGLADGSSRSARTVVLATPLAAARTLLVEAAPEAARTLATMSAEGLVSVVHAWRRADVAHALDGFGYLAPSRQESPVLGTLFCSSLWPRAAPEGCVLLRTLLGGARHAHALALDDAALGEAVLAEARARLGARGDPLLIRLARHPAVIPRLDRAHPARLTALERALPAGLAVLGNFTRGIGLARLVAGARALALRL